MRRVLFHITTVDPYPDDYASMLTRAREELDADARPALAGELPNLDDYDVIMIGYPIWHGATPRTVLTFLESGDLTGKRLIPFNTHEGSGQGGTVSEIAAAAPGAELLEGIAIRGKTAQERFNARDYTERIFNMYDEGEMVTVTLRCRHHMIDHIIDYFGKDVEPFNITDETFDVNVRVCASATFFSWVMGYVGEMTITGPQEVCDIYRGRLERELKIQYHPEYHG